MSDDISIPSPIYRVPRHSRGMDPATRKLALIAAGIGVTLLVAIGGWTMLGHRTHGVPVVQADSSPLRVKPLNPGGMQVAGAGNDIFSGGSDTSVEKLAPPPETPDPQGLRATPAARPAPVPAAAAQAPAPVAVTQPPPPAAATPLPPPPPAVAATRTAASVAAPVAAGSRPGVAAGAIPGAATAGKPGAASVGKPGVAAIATPGATAAATPGIAAAAAMSGKPAEKPIMAVAAEHSAGTKVASVQLAALTSEPAARAEWERLVKRWPDLFGGHQPAFSKVEHNSQVFWRLRTGGFAGVAQATGFCEQLRAKGGGCSVADF